MGSEREAKREKNICSKFCLLIACLILLSTHKLDSCWHVGNYPCDQNVIYIAEERSLQAFDRRKKTCRKICGGGKNERRRLVPFAANFVCPWFV